MRKSASIAALVVALVPALAPGLALADACMAQRGAPAMQGAGPGDGHGMGSGMGPGPMGPDFATLDSNADGKVTAEEVTAWRTAQFAAADANSDGKLSAEELTVWIEARRAEHQAQMAARMITRMDADGDGALSLVELPGADMANRLGWLDRNADGAIDAEEFAAMGQGGPGHDGPRGGDCGAGGHGRGGIQ
ncbi:MAG: calcium sensor EFh [Mangrovicoccus sp.]|nr:calcium sensor EFh [Mangrovicoccus sp.]